MNLTRLRPALVAAAALALPAAAASPALAADSVRTSYLLSTAADGGMPNGPSRNGVFSHDQRIARVAAFESDASDIVASDPNGTTDVFVIRRASGWGINGTFWNFGSRFIASTGLGGAPANGPSYKPALDGDSHSSPSCVAFVSEASNLVSGDTNGVADAFVRNLSTGKITRVSVGSRGEQANGATLDVAVDGDCERIAFTSRATNIGLRRTSNAAWDSAETTAPPAGSSQVYVRILRGTRHDRGFKGLTFIASASRSGRAGNRSSSDVAFARAGKAVVFTSEASNLAAGDYNGASDVYERTFTRIYKRIRGKGVQTLSFATRLVSQTSRGRAGNGPSSYSSVTDDGRYVAYQTSASNLLRGDVNGVSDVVEADMRLRRPKQTWASRAYGNGNQIGNGASTKPQVSDAGEFILFESLSTNLKPSTGHSNPNGVGNVFLWNRPTGNVSNESRDTNNATLPYPSGSPNTSSRGNYVPFESRYPLIDLNVAASDFPELVGDPDAAAARADNDPSLHQVYLRYMGPK